MNNIKAGNVYCQQESETKKYFAFQIIEDKGESVLFLLLDYFAPTMPEECDFLKLKPLIRQSWFWNDSLEYYHANRKDFPRDAVLVCNMPPLITCECKTYGGWSTGYELVGEAEWQIIPEETRYRFKEGLKNVNEITIAGMNVRRSLQHVDDELLSAMTDYMKELHELPAACHFYASRHYPQLIPFLETRHTTRSLEWSNHMQRELDLSRTHLRNITIYDENMVVLKLPNSCGYLTLNGKLHPNLRIEAPNAGQKLTLKLDIQQQGGIIPNLNIPSLNALTLSPIDGIDLASISIFYPNLHWLRLLGKPGKVINICALGRLSQLRTLLIEDIFGFEADEFPQPESFSNLSTLWLESLPEEAGKYLKKAFKGKIKDLEIKKLRKPEWMAENLDNPLRHWDGNEFVTPAKFRKSMIVYRDTRRVALAAAQEWTNDKDVAKLMKRLEQIASDYAEAFNQLDRRSNWILTDEREDLCSAFDVILKAVQDVTGDEFDAEQIQNTLDEHRDW